ncbi:DUF2573 family protein [Niallia sp. NCCP-28]|uniref:DUF2573 family protein n=1 Tax=Niallia sp. NCCP-28 TaxID=2934712 RepID=UPI0020837C04|nr:DUF2573 family protein [Niallia sp. NCCP-28]GKU83226.1 hypothetical protein NCCP28_26220 [Niallia sp. NCCP-28]
MEEFQKKFAGLLSDYTELLLGQQNEELQTKVEIWMLYSHMAKSMPSLVKHWNKEFPEGKQEIMNIIAEIKKINEKQKQNK